MSDPEKKPSRWDVPLALLLMFIGGFVSATWASRGYVQRHFEQCYMRGANDMKLAIFGAIDRLSK